MMQNNFMPSKAVVLVVASFLVAILIYSSVSQFDVSARKPKNIDNLCRDATPTISGAVKAEVCCQIINGNITVCIKCQYDANDNSVGSCINFYPSRLTANSTGLPASAGSALPPSGNNTGTPGKTSTGTLPPGSIIKVPPLSATETCPDGSQPDSSGKCPTSNPNTSSPPPSSSINNPPANNPQPSGGSSNGNGGGSGSSSNNNNGGGSSSSGTSSHSK